MHGYQIIQELGERSGGAWTPSPGSIYPALQLLQDEGRLSAAESEGKRVFLQFADEEREHLDLLVREYRGLVKRQGRNRKVLPRHGSSSAWPGRPTRS
jgi:DNA-binding PadR family transcriptional regulator